jgi:hypothetical protein
MKNKNKYFKILAIRALLLVYGVEAYVGNQRERRNA